MNSSRRKKLKIRDFVNQKGKREKERWTAIFMSLSCRRQCRQSTGESSWISRHQFFVWAVVRTRQMESRGAATLQRRLNISVSGPPSDAVTKIDETSKPPKNGWRDSDTHISLTQITRRQCITGYLRPVSNVHNPQARLYFDTRQADNDGVWLKNGTPAWTCPCKYALALSNSWPWPWVLLPWLKKGATSGAFSSSSTKIRCYFLS